MSIVRSSALAGYRELVTELGGSARALLERSGIAPSVLDDPHAFVSYPAFIRLLERSAEELRCPDFGLRLSTRQDLGILGALGVAVRNCETIGEAIACASKYMFVHSPAISFSLERAAREGNVRLVFRILLERAGAATQVTELSIGLAARVLGLLIDEPGVIVAVRFAHARVAPTARYRAHFRAPVELVPARAPEGAASIEIRAAHLALPLRDASRQLQQLAEHYLQLRFEDPGAPLAVRVRHVIERSLGTGASSCEDVAAALAVHPRTLQRLLSAEGTSFERLKDAARAELACRYLAQRDLSMSRIASMLDYAEQSAFSRSCRRWFDRTPRELRSQPDLAPALRSRASRASSSQRRGGSSFSHSTAMPSARRPPSSSSRATRS